MEESKPTEPLETDIQQLKKPKSKKRVRVIVYGTILGIFGITLFGTNITTCASGKAKDIKTTKIQMSQVETGLQNFMLDTGRFPTVQEGLKALIESSAEIEHDRWDGPYFRNGIMPTDAWGNPFKYKFPSQHDLDFDLISAGRDKVFGTEDDISNFLRAANPQ